MKRHLYKTRWYAQRLKKVSPTVIDDEGAVLGPYSSDKAALEEILGLSVVKRKPYFRLIELESYLHLLARKLGIGGVS